MSQTRKAPFLINEHLYLPIPEKSKAICIGYIDKTDGPYYVISLASAFGTDSEVCRGKKQSVARLYEIYKHAVKDADEPTIVEQLTDEETTFFVS